MSHDVWSIFLLIGAISWIASSVMFIFRVFPRREQFDTRMATRWGAVILVSFTIWIVGMLNA